MNYDDKYYDFIWEQTIKMLPKGGAIRFDMRQYIYSEVMKYIPEGSKVFDYACGLGLIDIRLEKEKNCICNGCDFSGVAVEYVNMNIKKGEFRHTDKIFGGKYDVILGIAFLEHTEKPREWINEMLNHTDNIILTIPNNFRQHGEHHLMQWKNWEEFGKILEGLNWQRVDDYKDNNHHNAWRSPVILIKKENKMHPDYLDSSTGSVKVVKEVKEKEKVSKRGRKKIKETISLEETSEILDNAESKPDYN